MAESGAAIDNLVINIEAIDRNAIVTIHDLGEALKSLKGGVSDFAGADLTTLVGGLGELNRAMEALNPDSIETLESIGYALSSIGEATSALKFDALENLDIQGLVDKMQGLQEPMNNILDPLTDLANSLIDVDEEMKRKPADAQKVAAAFKTISRESESSTSKLGKFTNMMKRMVMLKAIRSIISTITNGMKEGLSNAYQYSKLIGGDLAGSMDKLASSSLKMKNQLGSAFGEVIRAVQPIVSKIAEFITYLADLISRTIAIFNGSDTYLRAKDVSTEWEEASNGVKEYKRQLLGLDELNVLNDTKSGSGTPGADVSKMFEEVAVNSNISSKAFEKIDKVVTALKKVVNAVEHLLSSPGFQKLVNLITDIVSTVFVTALESFGSFCQIVEGLLSGDWNIFWEGMDSLGQSIASGVDALGSALGEFFGFNWEEFKNELGVWVGDVQDAIADFFNSFTQGFWQFLASPAMLPILDFMGFDTDAIKKAAGISTEKGNIPSDRRILNTKYVDGKWVRVEPIKIQSGQQTANYYQNMYAPQKTTTATPEQNWSLSVDKDSMLKAVFKDTNDGIKRTGDSILSGFKGLVPK